MPLEDKFDVHIGDLVVLSSSDRVDLVGYVRGYTHKSVQLSNRSYATPSGEKRDTNLMSAFPFGEKRYSTNLSDWETYKVLVSANDKEEQFR